MGGPSARGHEVRVQMGPDGGSTGGPGEGSTGGSGGWRSVGVQIVGAQGAQGAAVQDGLGGTRVIQGSVKNGLSGQSGLNDKIGIIGQGGINDKSSQVNELILCVFEE